jgi:hypothetical protein
MRVPTDDALLVIVIVAVVVVVFRLDVTIRSLGGSTQHAYAFDGRVPTDELVFLVSNNNAFGLSRQLTKTSNGRVATDTLVVVVVRAGAGAFRVKVVVVITSQAVVVSFYGVQKSFVVGIRTFLLV